AQNPPSVVRHGRHGQIRTADLSLRRRPLYPSELRARDEALLILNHFDIPTKPQTPFLAQNCIKTVSKLLSGRALYQNGSPIRLPGGSASAAPPVSSGASSANIS